MMVCVTALVSVRALLTIADGDNQFSQTLRKLRNAYFPSLLIAQISALQSAAHLVSREYILKCMDLSIAVAGSAGMMDCLRETKRAPDVIKAFAAASRALLRLNEAGHGKVTKSKKHARSEWTATIWDVEA